MLGVHNKVELPTVDQLMHAVIFASALLMVTSLLQPTHLDPIVWMAWFVPFTLIVQGYILLGFSKL